MVKHAHMFPSTLSVNTLVYPGQDNERELSVILFSPTKQNSCVLHVRIHHVGTPICFVFPSNSSMAGSLVLMPLASSQNSEKKLFVTKENAIRSSHKPS